MIVEDKTVLIAILVLSLIQGCISFTYFSYVKTIWRYIKFTYALSSLYIIYQLYGVIWQGKEPIHHLAFALLVAISVQLCGLLVSFMKVEISKQTTT